MDPGLPSFHLPGGIRGFLCHRTLSIIPYTIYHVWIHPHLTGSNTSLDLIPHHTLGRIQAPSYKNTKKDGVAIVY